MAESSTDHLVFPAVSRAAKEGIIRRVLTAAIAIPIVLVIAIYGDIAFVLAIAVMVIVGGAEVTRMSRPWLPNGPFWYGAIPAAGVAVASAIAFASTVALSGVLVGCSFALGLMALISASVDQKRSIVGLTVVLVASIYLGIGAGHLILLRSPNLQSMFGEPDGYQLVVFLMAIVWATDTAAFSVGRLVGRRPLALHISPNKTVEGGVAGLLAAGLIAVLLGPLIGLNVATAILAGLMVGVVAQAGDLVESLTKRVAGVKDSGTLFPGHGGLLDRADSLIFASPALYYVLKLTGSVIS